MKKTYQTPVIIAIDIAVESQILAGSSLGFGDGSIDIPGGGRCSRNGIHPGRRGGRRRRFVLEVI